MSKLLKNLIKTANQLYFGKVETNALKSKIDNFADYLQEKSNDKTKIKIKNPPESNIDRENKKQEKDNLAANEEKSDKNSPPLDISDKKYEQMVENENLNREENENNEKSSSIINENIRAQVPFMVNLF